MNIDLIQSRPTANPVSHRRATGVATALALICLTLPLSAVAEDGAGRMCSNATLQGEYGALVQGIRGISPVETEMFVGIALRKFDGKGGFIEEAASQHGAKTGLQGGVGADAFVVVGTYQVNADCTGTSTLTLPPPFPTIVSNFVITDSGKGINEIVTSPAANIVTAVFRKK